jgi:DNA polymerase
MKLTIDFETYSKVNLKKFGAWAYAEDRSTEVICMAVKIDHHPARIFAFDYYRELVDRHLALIGTDNGVYPWMEENHVRYLLRHADIIEAHNAGFERAIYTFQMLAEDWPEIPLEKWRCSAAKAAAYALPRSLEGAGLALGLPITKDPEGRRVMLKLCKPRKPTKNNASKRHENPEDYYKLLRYCMRDVEAEYCLSEALRDLSPTEQKLWFLDQEINQRGIQADVDAAECAILLMDDYKTELEAELSRITNGKAATAKQTAAMLEWVNAHGAALPNLQAETVKAALAGKNGLPADTRRVLAIRRSLALSSTAKYQAIIDQANLDHRLRGLLIYHGASTGRWTGSGFQPHNLPRGAFKDTDGCVELIRELRCDDIELLYGDLSTALSTCIRPMLCAAPGHDLICADFSSIEGRVLAWLADEKWVLDAYRAGKDMYVVNAARTLGIPEEAVTRELRQHYGKPGELACGYQGGANAVRAFGAGVGMTDEEIMAKIVNPWRDARPNIVQFWRDMEHAVMRAIKTGEVVYYRDLLAWAEKGRWLYCRLPSGRVLSYFAPRIKKRLMPWGKEKRQVSYYGVDTYTKKWCRQWTYGGKLTENIVQAVARDLMAGAMLRLEAAGYPVVLTVHDEIIAEVPEGFGGLGQFEAIMAGAPYWAEGLPIVAKGWRGKRYRKE